MYKVLIIDDSAFAVKVLEDILKDTYEVHSAASGSEGLALARKEQPSLILLDIEMPGMDGFEVLKELKEAEMTKEIPVIFLTGVIDSAYEERGFLNGAVDYIVKPYNSNVVKVRAKTHIDLAECHKRMEKQLNIDALTGVHNRRGLEQYIENVANRAVQGQTILSMLMVDIDYFKQVNDTYGHLQGDRVLQAVASALDECVPDEEGYVARYGGEEFAIVLPEKEKPEIDTLMERIFEKIRQADIPNENSAVCERVTISAGGAGGYIEEPGDAGKLAVLADKMLYVSKENGRDQFNWADGSEKGIGACAP